MKTINVKNLQAEITRYFDKTNGNSYYVLKVEILTTDNKEIKYYTNLEYGYGDQYTILLNHFDNLSSDFYFNDSLSNRSTRKREEEKSKIKNINQNLNKVFIVDCEYKLKRDCKKVIDYCENNGYQLLDKEKIKLVI